MLRRNLYIDTGRDHRSSLLVAGSARSGTTWLADVLNRDKDWRIMYEPFNKTFVQEALPFKRRQYLRPDCIEAQYVDGAQQIFSGALRNSWVDRTNRRFLYRKRIIKEVSANLMLRWINELFSEMPTVFIIRHPCAVALSRVHVGFGDPTQDWLTQPHLLEDHLAPFAELIRSKMSDFDRHVVNWCVENYVPLRQFRAGQLCVVFYEDLCVEPSAALSQIAEFLGRPIPVPMALLAQPSAQATVTAGFASAILTGEDLVDNWRQHVSAIDVARAMKIVALFGLDRIYSQESMPMRDRIFES